MPSRRSRRRDKKRNDRLRAEAWSLLESGRPDQARRTLQSAIAKSPCNARYWFELGEILAAEGRPERAQGAWRKALLLAPGHDAARERLAALGEEARGPTLAAAAMEIPAESPLPEDWRWRDAWPDIEGELLRTGAARLEALLPEERSTEPSEGFLEEVRSDLYVGVAHAATDWAAKLEERVCLPATLEELEEGDALDVPFEVALLTGERGRSGVVALSDRKRARRGRPRLLELRTGDAALVAVRYRIVQVGGAWGREAFSYERRAPESGARWHVLRFPHDA